jgi:hypothetical protein
MSISELKIPSKNNSPEITLRPEGYVRIKGRWMNGDVVEFSKPIINWIDEYVKDPAELTCVDIFCEYFSGNNSVVLMSLLRKIFNVKMKNKKLIINWYYEEGDEDILEQGEYISETLEIPFNFIIISEQIMRYD